jgi:hypothetical protein
MAATRTAEPYLGYWMDFGLEFAHHREKAIKKVDVSLQALRVLAGSDWVSLLLSFAQNLLVNGNSQMLYAVSAWYQPMAISKLQAHTTSQPFVAIQKWQ